MGDRGVDPGFVADIDELFKGLPLQTADKMRDDVYQLYLKTLPNLSARKHFLHRKATEGYSTDALRAFAHNGFHGAYQVARLKWGHRLEKAVRDAENAVKTATDKEAIEALREAVLNDEATVEELFDATAAAKDVVKAADLVNELKRRHQWTMNPQGGAIANKATSLGFVWYLGASPAAALVNLTQVPLVALPILGAKYGFTAASAELLRAQKDIIAGGASIKNGFFSIAKTLTDEQEKDAYHGFLRDGVIDKSLAHDLAGLAESGTQYSDKWHRVMGGVSWSFHKAEVNNREVTAMAAYRLARKAGESHVGAMRSAEQMTWDSQFDYSTGNKPRFMQSDFAKVALLFKQYAVNMTYLIYRTAYQAVKAEKPADRSEARKRIGAMMALHFVAVGALGFLPEPIPKLLAAMAAAVFGDDDEPFDLQTELRILLAELFGKRAGEALSHGMGNALGVDLSNRIGLDSLWIRDDNKDLEGKAQFSAWTEQALGPVWGIGASVADGIKLMSEGQVQRGVEKMLPKFTRDGLKALRYASDGALTMRGDPLIDNMSGLELVAQAIGFTPSRLSERYEENSAKTKIQDAIQKRKEQLVDRYALALRFKDADMRKETLVDIKVFNQKNANVAITGEGLMHSLQARARYAAHADGGIVLDKRQRSRLERVEFAD